MVMQGFRWEAGIQYASLASSVDVSVSSDHYISRELINYVMLYDWEYSVGNEGDQDTFPRDDDEREQFIRDMIMAYMIRNEMAVVPDLAEQRVLPADAAADFGDEFSRTTNSRTKFSEFYTWAKLMPHMQLSLIHI